MPVGFIGLGNLGRAMAGRLIAKHTELLVWNRTRAKCDTIKAEAGESPADVISRCDTVILNLFDSDAVFDVITGEQGLLAGACEGKLVIDTTTNHFESVLGFYDLLGQVGASYVEAPVLGSVLPAASGTLTIAVSGDEDAYGAALPLLDLIGTTIFYLREPGLASRMKLINNMVLGVFMTGLAESLALAEAAGLDREVALDVLAAGAGSSLVLKAKRSNLLNREYPAHFSVDAIYKDLFYLQDLARQIERPLFTGSTARELFGLARKQGLGREDLSAVYKAISE
ncbi:NAD(P)-dependent oxidoreductase [bacterium]|nr:NAD(P)-dependent oxidoreductase [bacterium]